VTGPGEGPGQGPREGPVTGPGEGPGEAADAAPDGAGARVAELLDQARARLESLSSAGTTADGHAEIYAQVHRLLTEALQATAAGV